ncbi:MAG: Na+:solute symporter [Candidatus Krumholzibacteriota bacterium]|nr:Na+:solute symporter [Candidatus Krumholzibacteriota bacterium]
MTFSGADIAVLSLYLAVLFIIGIVMSRRASRSTEEFFVSGRSLPWWIIGTSMVATTFAADTPLVVSGLVAQGGIFKNWIWWYWGIAAMVAVFLFAKLWNRAGVTTDAELIELRYDGKPAAGLRFYRALWFGLFQNILVIAWVMKAMAKIILVVMGWDGTATVWGMHAEVFTVLLLLLVAVGYSVLSGLWGVVITDFLQFFLAMGGSVYLAVASYLKLGGMAGIKEMLAGGGFDVGRTLKIIPGIDSLLEANPFTEFIILILVVWWASYSVDAGGYLSQRLLAARDERHSVFGYLWFCIAHICLRPWPWIVVGLCGMAMFGAVDDPETYYPLMMREMLPPGVFGLVLAAFFAAFMSTIDTHLNWGSSLLVNDILRRFYIRGRTEKEYVLYARLSMLTLAVAGALASFAVHDISLAWKLVISVTAGVGSVYIARWYWWRVNAWSEITAMAAALVCTLVFGALSTRSGLSGRAFLIFPYSTALTVVVSVSAWITVTLLTPPVGADQLERFYKKVRPGGPGWKPVGARIPGVEPGRFNFRTLLNILAGLVMMISSLVGTGRVVLGKPGEGAWMLALALASGGVLFFSLKGQLSGGRQGNR